MTLIIGEKQPQIHHLCIPLGPISNRKGRTWCISSKLMVSWPKEAVQSSQFRRNQPSWWFLVNCMLWRITGLNSKSVQILFENINVGVKTSAQTSLNLAGKDGQSLLFYDGKNLEIVIFQREDNWISKTCSLSQIHTHMV